MRREAGNPGEDMAAMRQILEYLIQHPDANDTLEGVLGFWLNGGGREFGDSVVRQALELLVARKWLTVRPTPSRGSSYGLHKNCLQEVHRFLAGEGRLWR